MAKERSIRIRISHQRVEALCALCAHSRDVLQPATDHHHLLNEYLGELHQQLLTMAKRNQQGYTLCLSRAEAMAFRQAWQLLAPGPNAYYSLVADTLLKKCQALAA